jgi:acyl dehydratase
MNTRPLLYLDDLAVGQRFVSDTRRIDAADIVGFAREFDPQPYHLDEDAARRSSFGELVASGWHTAALTMRLLVDGGLPVAGGILGVGGEISWMKPTRPGDVLQVHSEVIDIRPSQSRPDRGIATIRNETRNQRNETLQVFTARIIVPRRPTT